MKITVASVDQFNELTNYSNFGEHTVHVAAPGGDQYTGALYSTAIPTCSGACAEDNTPYVGMSGTSMATPVVAGLAAVIKSANGSLTPKQIKEIIKRQGDWGLKSKKADFIILNNEADFLIPQVKEIIDTLDLKQKMELRG